MSVSEPRKSAGSPPGETPDVTGLLFAWRDGDARAQGPLLDAVYAELHAIAVRQFRGERRQLTLQPTALVHEAYLKLIDQKRVDWKNRAQFFAIAAQTMRRILVDQARRRRAEKRGGHWQRIALEVVENRAPEQTVDLVALDDALDALAKVDPWKARLVELRFFAGLKFKDIAMIGGRSLPTVNRNWRAARAWLYRSLQAGVSHGTRA